MEIFSESPVPFADRSAEQARAKRESDERATSLAEAILTSDRLEAPSQSKKPSTVGSATESAKLQVSSDAFVALTLSTDTRALYEYEYEYEYTNDPPVLFSLARLKLTS